jgi:hypothetical protein
VYFTTTSDFNPGNIVTVQLSDINGSFSNLQNIGSKTTVHSDSILITLPANISTSPNYKIRLVASSPLDTTASYPIWIHRQYYQFKYRPTARRFKILMAK